MEKIVAALWAPEGETREAFGEHILAQLPQALRAAGARHLRINVRDDRVRPGDGLIQTWQDPQPAAIAQFWMASANDRFRGQVDAALGAASARFAAWLVVESTIIANTKHPPQPGAVTEGWSQASFITFRADRPRADLVAHWTGHHTRVAIETQANFEYVQNLIVRPLTPDAPGYDAFVEECFPLAALSNPHAFFDAVGQPDKFAANLDAMMDSCQAFIDFARVDIIPTSQYVTD